MCQLRGGRTGGVCVDGCLHAHMIKVFARVTTQGQNL